MEIVRELQEELRSEKEELRNNWQKAIEVACLRLWIKGIL